MRLGTRWNADDAIPASVPTALHSAIHDITRALTKTAPTHQGQQYAQYWTLTWLENRPICRHDSGVEITLDVSGSAVRIENATENTDSSEDDWLT